MIDVSQALEKIKATLQIAPIEHVPLDGAQGRILRQSIVADRPFPPFDRVTMDGIACQYAAIERGQRSFTIQSIQAAGQPPQTLLAAEQAIEVMTGAVLPKHCDTVIRYEDITIEAGQAHLKSEAIKWGQNIHRQGSDRTEGACLVAPGRRLGATELMTAATVGRTEVAVSALPKVAIIATGDELVEVAARPEPHQIRRSNIYAVQALLADIGVKSDLFHLKDAYEPMKTALQILLADYDILILSGAVSEGKFDFLPQVLTELGVVKVFHKVAQRPGKPFWFGTLTPNKTIFALPGNPVSTFLCTCKYILPWLKQHLAWTQEATETAILTEKIIFKPNLTYFVPVKSAYTEGVLRVTPLLGQGSGDLANLNEADAFIELSANQEVFEAGSIVSVIRFRPL